ncbi:MAG: hypothetical protein WC197_02820 [Candidatus Gastranaerophilaceae bacterium]|jgi:hypothetical protein
MTSSITSASSAVNQQIQDFMDGKTTISQSDLTSIVASEISGGKDINSGIMDLVDSYESVDTNHDGQLTYSEYSTYKNSPAAILSSLGLKNSSTLNSNYSLLHSDMFANSSDDTFAILESGSSSVSSRVNSLLDSLSLNNTTTDSITTSSLLDYLD